MSRARRRTDSARRSPSIHSHGLALAEAARSEWLSRREGGQAVADPLDAEYFALLEHRFDDTAAGNPELAAILRIGLEAFDLLEQHLHRSAELSARQFRSRTRAMAGIRDGRAALYSAVDHASRVARTP